MAGAMDEDCRKTEHIFGPCDGGREQCADLTKSSAQHDTAGAEDAAAVSPPTTHRQVPLQSSSADPLNNRFPCIRFCPTFSTRVLD